MVRCHRFCLLKLCLLKLFVLKLCLLGISCAEQTQKTDSRSRSATNPGLKGSFNQNAATGTVTDTNPVQSTESNNPADNADVDPNTDSGSTDGPDEDPGSNSSNTTSEQIGQKPVSSPGAGDGISEENENNSGAAMDNNSSSQNSTNNSGDGLLPVVAEFLPGPVSEPGILPLTVNPKIAATKQIPLEGNQKLLIAEDAVFLETEPGKTIGFAHSFGQLELAGTEDNRIFLVRPRQTDREKFEYFELTQAGLQQKLIDLAENTNALHIRRAGGSWVHVPPLYSPLPENPTDPIIGNGGQPILLQVYEGSEWKERPIASVSEDNQPVDLSKDPILLMRRIPGIILGSGERLPNPDPSMAYILITYDLGQTWKYKTLPFKAAGSALLHTDGYLGFRTQEGLAVSNNGQDFTQKPYPVFDPAPELGQPITRYFTDKMIVVHTQETEANPHIIAADLTENWGVFSEFADCADVEWNRLQSGFVYQPTGQPRSLNLATKSCEKVPELQNPVVFDDSRRQVNGQEFRWYAATPDSQFVLQQRASGSQNWIDRPDVTFQKSASCTGNPGLVHFFSQTGTFETSYLCSIDDSPRYYRFVSQDMGVSWQKQQSDLRDYSTLQDGTRFKIAPAIGNVPLRALVSQDQGATWKTIMQLEGTGGSSVRRCYLGAGNFLFWVGNRSNQRFVKVEQFGATQTNSPDSENPVLMPERVHCTQSPFDFMIRRSTSEDGVSEDFRYVMQIRSWKEPTFSWQPLFTEGLLGNNVRKLVIVSPDGQKALIRVSRESFYRTLATRDGGKSFSETKDVAACMKHGSLRFVTNEGMQFRGQSFDCFLPWNQL